MIPKLNVTTALTITDGADVAGFIAEHDGAFFAYGADHVLIGEYTSRVAASRAIPVASTSPQRGTHRRARSRTTSHR
jgi:hypothetical protein